MFKAGLFLSEDESVKVEGGLRTHGHFKKSYEDKSLISIVTVVYNGEKYLEQAIKSVLEQSYDNVEYVIIDGGSTDGTLDIIKKYENKIDYWVSEPDEGIFSAMNKGLVLSTGDYIGFINSDDSYKKDIIEKVADSILVYPTVDFFYGDVDVITKEGNYLFKISGMEQDKKLGINIPHPSCFIRLDVHRMYPFDVSYKIAADRVLITELLINKYPHYYFNCSIANFMEGGASSNAKLCRMEMDRFRLKYFGIWTVVKDIIGRNINRFGIRTKLKKLLKQIKGK